MKTEYKYISFKPGDSFNGKPLWFCHNKKSDSILANIFWYPPWRQYCFSQAIETAVFNTMCLADIQDFIKQLTDEQKAKA